MLVKHLKCLLSGPFELAFQKRLIDQLNSYWITKCKSYFLSTSKFQVPKQAHISISKPPNTKAGDLIWGSSGPGTLEQVTCHFLAVSNLVKTPLHLILIYKITR